MKSLSKLHAQLGVRRGGPRIAEDVVYRIYAESKTKKVSCLFSLSGRICNKMRWMSGDRMDILFDAESKEGQIIRCKEGGWCLSNSGGQEGDNVRKQVRLTYNPEFGLPAEATPITFETTENTIAFKFQS